MAQLSTHVLDTSIGLPARGMAIDLYAYDAADNRTHLNSLVTNGDGRTDAPVLSSLIAGKYELIFHAGDYFRTLGEPLPEPLFLDEVVIRFGVADASRNYHVPLLLSLYGYSTYRGS